VLVACPDARPPAYQAAVGFAEAGRLQRLVTGFYYPGHGTASELVRRLAPCRFARIRKTLRKRHDRRIPSERVDAFWSFDASLAAENRLGGRFPRTRQALARHRTRRFDGIVARELARRRPDAALIFSDVGSELAFPTARRLGIPTILSMVHGDVREEMAVLEREAEQSPDFFPIYLGDGQLDLEALRWLHDRRLRDVAQADRILVPSRHIADTLARHGTPTERISVIPYAADTQRFRPLPDRRHGPGCTFLFAGGITQRKGIKYLLEAWRMVRRPGWKLQLVGSLPSHREPLLPYLGECEHLGQVAHADMPGRMASADVFVFPSLFEGSAVVTYEALASGLPSVVTTEAGSVVRDGVEGFVVGAGDVEDLAGRMERLGADPELRAEMARAARTRALEFGWPTYHAALIEAVDGTEFRAEPG
jgi:glycosyltransferase involved in cell wall biosynthesis